MSWNVWRNLPFRKKIQISFIVIVIIPTLLFGGFIYYSLFSYANSSIMQEINSMIHQNITDLSNKMRQCEISLTYLACNYSLHNFLTDEQSNNLELSKYSMIYIGPLLYNVILSGANVRNIEIYIPKTFAFLSPIIKQEKIIENEEWYYQAKENNNVSWWMLGDSFYVIRRIININAEHIGIIRLHIKRQLFDESFSNYFPLPANIQIISNDNPIYSWQNEQQKKSGSYINVSCPLPRTNWYIQYTIDKSYFPFFQSSSFFLAFGVSIFCFIIIAIVIRFLSNSLLKRIFILTKQMCQIRQGNLDIIIDTSSGDEIGELAASFDAMIKQINTLINEVYLSNIRQKDIQIQLLQSKIKPHFLYNNLSKINWIAIESNQFKICEITGALALFYRTALNQGKEFCLLETELINAKTYMCLQKIAHDDGFNFLMEIEKGIEAVNVPCFILQPLLENATEHGTNYLQDGGGEIKLRGFSKEGIIYLQVIDNGTKLYLSIGETSLEKGRYGYGLNNVDQRISLIYGSAFGVTVKADIGGTCAELRLPLESRMPYLSTITTL
jgi:two-component system sensor histidine kinase YesM